MPELPEVETVRRSLNNKVIGRAIISCEISETIRKSFEIKKKPILKKQTPDEFEYFFQNVSIIDIKRRSKYLIFEIEKNGTPFFFISHLGMSGAWFVVDDLKEIEAKFRRNKHITFRLDNQKLFVYCDIRRFGEANVLTEDDFLHYRPIQSLGPEPFDANALTSFIENSREKQYEKKAIKAIIMKQQVVAGVGNIYACEALFLSSLHPLKTVKELSDEQLTTLFKHILDLLNYSISVGGASISDYVDSEGKKGNFQNTMKVYQQKQCPICQHDIENVVIEQRSSFYCPNCQI